MVERTFNVGMGTITDVYEAKAKHALVKEQYVAAENDIVTKQAELDRPVGELVVLPHMRLMQGLPTFQGSNLQEWLAAAVSGNLQIKIQQAEKVISKIPLLGAVS